MDNWKDIPNDDTGLLIRYHRGVPFYIRAGVIGSKFSFVYSNNRYTEVWLYPHDVSPNWSYRNNNGWLNVADSSTVYHGIPSRINVYQEEEDSEPASGFAFYSSVDEAIEDFFSYLRYPITYRPTNCLFPGAPLEAMVGDTVVVPVSFPDGYGLVNESNIYVTNNGAVIPSTYSNGQLTFTMPDPS